jgi:glucose 1-dehydrogenase
MKDYYKDRNLPEPALPEVQTLTLLKGQTAIVTGANSGIGRAIAVSLGKAGANVVVNYVVKPEEAEAVAAEIRKGGQRAMIAHADVSDERRCRACSPPRCASSAPSTFSRATPAWSATRRSTR